ncbi:MAG: hypothetical protein KDB60_16890 [Propionibacteriaceae bacterium]|nr:hypothetical protein [Propionibacteriaceae bacterium]
MSSVEFLGWLAALTASLLGVPQAVRLWRTRVTAGPSLVAWQACPCSTSPGPRTAS